jgi:predicted lipoprotein with Yx(FWY)xxD motif
VLYQLSYSRDAKVMVSERLETPGHEANTRNVRRALVVVAALAFAASGAKAAPTSGPAVVKVAYNAKLHAKILVTGNGLALYMWASDYKNVTACVDSMYHCPTVWPPYRTSGPPKAGPGAKASLLGTAKRPDGGTQVMYAGHLLYTFHGGGGSDRPDRPGDVNGQNYNNDWWVLSPAGTPIKKRTTP